MAYNKKNKYRLILDIQSAYKKHSKHWEGEADNETVYYKIIKPIYHISRTTFYTYLDTNAAKLLKELEAGEEMQKRLF